MYLEFCPFFLEIIKNDAGYYIALILNFENGIAWIFLNKYFCIYMEKAVLQNKKYKLEMKFYEDMYTRN